MRRAKALTHADPLDSATTLGAMVEENALQRVLGYVDAAVAQGAVAVAGCSRALVETGGDYMGPPVLDGVSPDAVRRSRRSSVLSWCSFRSTPWKRPSPLPMEFRSGRRRRCGPRTRPLRI
ncbi:aldehyde dehydrogenase family protein [Rhodococcus sp. IEGM 248]|nr:aldehyde dehydrogenase family protein [Rhodococcus sp. IEGM 248]